MKVYDKDDEKLADDYVGRFDISDLVHYQPPANGHKIIGLFGQCNGRFHLFIQSMPSNDETRQLPMYTFDGPCRYSRNDSNAVGHLTMLNADCIYSTWKIRIRRISSYFAPHERQHWNRQYKAAQTIFGGCPQSIVSQGTIKLAHKALYGRKLRGNQNGQLHHADDLRKLIFADPVTGQIKPCVYTYVIDDHTWRFSETGHKFFIDYASKHALLANVSESVRYAGEFHARPKHGWDQADDEWELVFDNGSGTYAPTAELLANLQELLEFNFPGLNVLTYDFKDPHLKESVERLKAEMKRRKHSSSTVSQLVAPHQPVISNE